MDKICNFNECTGCSLCHDVCQHQAIKIIENKDGFISPIIDQSLCVDCGLCKKTCPVLNLHSVSDNRLHNLKVYEAWAEDDNIRKRSSSGGVFGQIAYDTLKKGGIVIGVAFDGIKAFHTVVSSIDELSLIQDTKYVQSYAQDSYKATYELLKLGNNVVFSGTPCQVAACKSFLSHKKHNGKLLTIELVCHGVPSYLALKKSIEYADAKMVVHFREKSQGWGYHSQRMCYEAKDGGLKYRNRDEDLFYRMFFSEKLLRPSCYTCPFAHFPRVADITIGDSWGTNNDEKEEVYKGLSLLLINNANGQEWIRNSKIKLRNTSIFDSLYINRNVYTPFPSPDLIELKHDIGDWISQLDLHEYMNQTQLGFEENFRRETFVSRKIRKLNDCVRKKLQIKDVKDLSFLKYSLLMISYKLNCVLNPKPSEKYLSKIFTKVINNIYKARR